MTSFSNKIKKSHFWAIFVAIFSKNPALSCTSPHGAFNTMLSFKETNELIPGKLSGERIDRP